MTWTTLNGLLGLAMLLRLLGEREKQARKWSRLPIKGPGQSDFSSSFSKIITDLKLSDEAPALPPGTLDAIVNMHVIDQSIRDIARDFRFTVEEVQEYYDKCGEMGRTRLRFQRMREELVAKFCEDM